MKIYCNKGRIPHKDIKAELSKFVGQPVWVLCEDLHDEYALWYIRVVEFHTILADTADKGECVRYNMIDKDSVDEAYCHNYDEDEVRRTLSFEYSDPIWCFDLQYRFVHPYDVLSDDEMQNIMRDFQGYKETYEPEDDDV